MSYRDKAVGHFVRFSCCRLKYYSLQRKWWSILYTYRNFIRHNPKPINGFGTVFVSINGLQNGAPDGIALVDNTGKSHSVLSYEGVLLPLMVLQTV
jgi:hypothetical protein